MSRQPSRETIKRDLQKQVLERDKHSCRKCGSNRKLEIHHIDPVANGGATVLENLITLCKHCHSEWEHAVYVRIGGVLFENWLEIPTAPELILFFANEKYWNYILTGLDVRKGIMMVAKSMRELREYYGSNEEEAS